uniref:Fibronectin type-III domain-containing protein n=1 Tax=Amphimedon queenslandica TaxID=400682 RepID=A0A1X7UNT1_AMPQE
MATTGIYWCLVLTECLSLVTCASLVQTIPPYPTPVCPGGRLVLTCTASTNGVVRWIGDSGTHAISSNGTPIMVDSFNVTATLVDGATVSYATNESVPVQLNKTTVSCSDKDNGELIYSVVTIYITDIQEAVTNVEIDPIDSNTLIINWNGSELCIDHYNVTINSNNTLNESRTTNDTNITIDTLIVGTNYSFIIIPIDTIGREGPPSSLIQYIWNVPAQVVNISWYQISTDSITIWWNNNEDSTIPHPPTQYYIINVYNTSNSINTNNTNVTITGLPLADTNYTVTIIPVNVIGYGPSVTVNA